MALRTLILASSPREGGHYAKRAELERWTYRVIHGANQVRGLPWTGCEVHILPSFEKAPNRFAILAALRHKRGLEYFFVDPDDLPTVEEIAGRKQAEGLGELTDEQLDAAYAEHEQFDHIGFARRRLMAEIPDLSDEEAIKRIVAVMLPNGGGIQVADDPKTGDLKITAKSKRKPSNEPAQTKSPTFFGTE